MARVRKPEEVGNVARVAEVDGETMVIVEQRRSAQIGSGVSVTVPWVGPLTLVPLGSHEPGAPAQTLIGVPEAIDARLTDVEWDVTMRVVPDGDGTPRIESLRIARRVDGPWISPEILRIPRVGEALRSAVRMASERYRLGDDGRYHWDAPSGSEGISASEAKKLYARPRVKSADVDQVASEYRALRASGYSGDILQRISERVHLSRATVARRVKRARAEGILTD